MNTDEIIAQSLDKIDSETIVDLAQKLIQIPSTTGQEKGVADWAYRFFSDHDVPVQFSARTRIGRT